MKLKNNAELIKSFNKMQKIYILDDVSKISIKEVRKTIKELLDIFKEDM